MKSINLQEKCRCGCIRQRHAAVDESGDHVGNCNGFQKDVTGKKYACPCVGFHVSHWPQITEQQIIDAWKKWGTGSELPEGFAKRLADDLNRDPFPMVKLDYDWSKL